MPASLTWRPIKEHQTDIWRPVDVYVRAPGRQPRWARFAYADVNLDGPYGSWQDPNEEPLGWEPTEWADYQWKEETMGSMASAGMRSAARAASGNLAPTDPRPDRYRVIRKERIGRLWLSEVHYPDCTTYEGRKILVTRYEPMDDEVLDPHFTTDAANPVVARFEPTGRGWLFGQEFLKAIR